MSGRGKFRDALDRQWARLVALWVEDKPKPSAAQPDPKRRRILIADDDGVILKVLARRFSAQGFEVFTAADGDKAVEVFHANKLDVVLLDLVMPNVDGVLALREMRHQDPTLPAIVMSGVASERQAQAALDEGAVAFVPKPIDFARLDAILASALPGR